MDHTRVPKNKITFLNIRGIKYSGKMQCTFRCKNFSLKQATGLMGGGGGGGQARPGFCPGYPD